MVLAPAVSVAQSITANGVATPATLTITPTAKNLLVVVITVLGTSPTLATPTGGAWVQVQKVSGATLTMGMYILPNNPGGAQTPSAVLGGTVTGWDMIAIEFAGATVDEALIASFSQSSAIAALTNVFPVGSPPTLVNELFVYAVGRATATITTNNTILAWSASINAIAGVQGMSLDVYWAVAPGPSPFPAASGLLSGAVASVQIGAVLNSDNAYPLKDTPAGGPIGVYVPQFYQGTIGG